MEDTEIIALYRERTEAAIAETERKYGGYLFAIAWNVVKNKDDAEEIVNDTYQAAWNTIPPEKPTVLRHYLSRIARNLALKRLEYNLAGKRSCKGTTALEELEECIPGSENVEAALEAKELERFINGFLAALPENDVTLFLLRYYYAMSIREISGRCGLSERNVKYRLSKVRKELKEQLKKEGLFE